MNIPRLVISGATSGVGKTSITCAIIYGLKKRGYTIQPFKVGPDYIDPSFLTTIAQKAARNLDSWLMNKDELLKNFISNSTSDISIIEGVMGYYDGFEGTSNYSSTFDIASLLGSPSILILDASKTSRSIAAMALGFLKFHNDSKICGIILNKIGSKKHEVLCRQALENLKVPIIGVIPRKENLTLKSRHLGLIPATEQKKQSRQIKKISKTISDYIDFEKLIAICKSAPPLKKIKKEKILPPKTTIGVALDNSFNFYYQENLENLRSNGAKLEFFSPIFDSKLPNCDSLYIGGGFPEILGPQLVKNQMMKKSIKKIAQQGMPIYGECGGLMYLTKSISYDSKNFPMVGLFDAATEMTKKMTLNYTNGQVIKPNIILKINKQFHGHEFHYSKLKSISSDSKFSYKLSIGKGIKNQYDGLLQYNTIASYSHLIFNKSIAIEFIKNSIKFSKR